MAQFQFIDYRLGEQNFRKYEPLLATALRAWPATTSFPTPDDIATTTFVARFRDVILGFRTHRWPSMLIPTELFDSIDGKFVLRPDLANRSVIFDHKSKAGRPQTPFTSHSSPSSPLTNLGPYHLTDAQQHAFCVLLDANLLPGCTIQLSHPLTVDTSPYPNVTSTPHTNGITLLL